MADLEDEKAGSRGAAPAAETAETMADLIDALFDAYGVLANAGIRPAYPEWFDTRA